MILLGTLAGLITLKIIIPGTSSEFIIVWWITVYLLPLVVTTILHFLKIALVRRSFRVSSAKSANRKLVQRMSTIVIMVILMAAILPLPRLVFNCLRVVGDNAFPSKEFKSHFRGISHMLFLINNFINPFMYTMLSKKFRNSVKEAFHFIGSKVTEDSDTTESPLTSERRQTSLEMSAQNNTVQRTSENGPSNDITPELVIPNIPPDNVTQDINSESMSHNGHAECVTKDITSESVT
jgi:hypothetical protein